MLDIFLAFFIGGLGVISVVGLVTDNHLDKKYGISYDHYGNEIAHNTSGVLLLVWCLFCIFIAFILNDLNLLK